MIAMINQPERVRIKSSKREEKVSVETATTQILTHPRIQEIVI